MRRIESPFRCTCEQYVIIRNNVQSGWDGRWRDGWPVMGSDWPSGWAARERTATGWASREAAALAGSAARGSSDRISGIVDAGRGIGSARERRQDGRDRGSGGKMGGIGHAGGLRHCRERISRIGGARGGISDAEDQRQDERDRRCGTQDRRHGRAAAGRAGLRERRQCGWDRRRSGAGPGTAGFGGGV